MSTTDLPDPSTHDDESADSTASVGVGSRPVMLSTRRAGQNRRVLAFGGVLLVAIGFLVVKGLGNASTYFRTTDEAVAQVASLGERRFRIEGVVVDGSVRRAGKAVEFLIEGNGKQVMVSHEGDPPELFRPNIAVVLEGRFASDQVNRPVGQAPLFTSDHLMVKHDSNYIEKNADRVKDYVGKNPTS